MITDKMVDAALCAFGDHNAHRKPWQMTHGHELDAMRAALLAADAAAWEPISAAPGGATLVDLWCPQSHTYAVRGRYWEQDGQWLEEETTRVLNPVKWRPLPAPPSKED